jgi:hypothetical protein
MKRILAALVFVALATSALAAEPSATGTQAITLTGVKNVGEIWLDTLKKLPPITVTVSQQTDKGATSAVFKGALLWTVIDNAGWVNGPGKNSYIRHTVLVAGKDGYAAALSEGEIDPRLEGKQVILAYEKDGVPLDAPRLVVPGDAHASRGVHDVVGIEVK